MAEFILSPVEVKDEYVTIQLYVDSDTRNHGFCGVLSFTRNEFEAFRGALKKGVSRNSEASLNIHPQLLPGPK